MDLERAKSVGEIIGDAVRCYTSYPALFATLTLAVVVPYALSIRVCRVALARINRIAGGTKNHRNRASG